MKKLTLVRHAKSSWKDAGLADRDRPLNKRGRQDAPRMGKRLAQRAASPDQIISSPAVRALTTAKIMAEEIGYPPDEIIVDERLYGADIPEWLAVIRGLDDALEHVLLVGHNPGLTDLVNDLSPDGVDNVPTCGVVEMTFDVETWTRIGSVEPTAVDLDYPKSAG